MSPGFAHWLNRDSAVKSGSVLQHLLKPPHERKRVKKKHRRAREIDLKGNARTWVVKNILPSEEGDNVCEASNPDNTLVCVGKKGHKGPHVSHTSHDDAASIWHTWSDKQFRKMQVTLRLVE